MDYEKAYKAIVQRARELHKDGNALTKQQMEIVCPELTESNDERIWNDIMEAVENWLPCERVEEIRAYLNAKKEQHSDGNAMLHVAEKSYQIGLRDGRMEQKHPIQIVDINKAIVEDIRNGVPTKTIEETRGIKFATPIGKEQKPVEWSEEDEKMLNECVIALSNWRDAVSNYGHEVAPCQRLIDWLKSLRSRPKVSDNWKPSEEQMNALKEFVDEARGIHNASMGGYTPYLNLNSLYNDLLKL